MCIAKRHVACRNPLGLEICCCDRETSISKRRTANMREMVNGNSKSSFNFVVVGQFRKGLKLALFSTLTVRNVKECQPLLIFIRYGGGYAGVHAARDKTDRKPRLMLVCFSFGF